MSRPKIFSRGEFLSAWNSCKDVKKTAGKLNTSLVTVYKWLAKLSISTPKRIEITELTEALDAAYKGTRTVDELAQSLGKTSGDVRYHLEKVINKRWQSKSINEKYPKPKLAEYKIVLELEEDEHIFDHPEEIQTLTGLPLELIQNYLHKLYEFRSSYVKN